MSVSARKLKFAVNAAMKNKNEAGDRSLFASGFENVEWDPDQFTAAIQSGWAYCPQLTGSRKTENFLASDIASVDVDHGLTIGEALAHPLVKEHALLLYTTFRHTPEAHRFRVVFPLPRTITKPGQMVAVTRSLTRMLGGDRAAVDATRISYGNRDAEVHRIDREVSDELLKELLIDAPVPDGADISSETVESRRSWIALKSDHELRLVDGRWMSLLTAPLKATVHCPIHHDKRASAFVLESQRGDRGVYCSACAKSYWPAREAQDDFDFDDFVRISKQAATLGKPLPSEHAALMGWNVAAREYHSGCNIHIVTGVPTPTELLSGVTLVKSPKGSGKTEGLKRLQKKAKKPLLIGHRRTLIRGSCKRLGLNCYLDKSKTDASRAQELHVDPGTSNRQQVDQPETEAFDLHRFFSFSEEMHTATDTRFTCDGYGICLDSLLQIRPDEGYDLIILDESEQVLRHNLSDTLAGRNLESRIFTLLTELVRRAKYVIALDADLGYLTFNTLARMVSNKDQNGAWRLMKPLHLWINDVPPPGQKTVQLYASKHHLVAQLMQAIADGKRCFVASNTKVLVDNLAAVIRDRFGDTRRIIVITADTDSLPEVKDFVENAKERTPTYDVILCSPSLGTGVDLTFPDNAVVVDAVFGFCQHNITTHFDFDQQVARVRHPGAVNVWISPRRFHYETHVDVVRLDLLRAGLHRDLLIGFEADGRPRFVQDDPLIEMASQIRAGERASKNNLLDHFIRYKQAQGCTIEHVGKDLEQSVTGLTILKQGQHLREEDLIAKVTAASPLPKPDFERIGQAREAGHVVTEAKIHAYERTRLELFYRRPATPELVRLDDRGRHRKRVRLFEEVTRLSPDRVQLGRSDPLHADLRFIRAADDDIPSAIVRLLWLTPLWRKPQEIDSNKTEWFKGIRGRMVLMPNVPDRSIEERVAASFDTEVVFDTSDLQAFARYMLDNKGALENLLDHEVRKDILKKPTQQLGLVLKMMGLSLSKTRTGTVSGNKVRGYRLNPTTLQEMQELAATREKKRGWAFLADRYGSHMDPSEYDEWGLTDDEEWTALDDDEWVGLDDAEWAEVEESIRKAEQFLRKTTRGFL